MARDLVTNLTINSKGFSSGLDRAKRELKAFDRSIGGTGSAIGGTVAEPVPPLFLKAPYLHLHSAYQNLS